MEKINIAELLMDCPEGMELDCTTWENVTFEKVVNNNIIIRRNNKEPYIDTEVVLNQYGCFTNYSDEKCVIFPKGRTTWEGFVPHQQFKVGNKIKNKYGFTTSIVKIIDGYYKYDNGDGRCGFISIKNQDEWELVSNKFDINTLGTFDKVLVRTHDNGIWEYDLFSFYNNRELYNKFHCVGIKYGYCMGINYRYCIPYKGNEKLLGTTNDCDEYFKTWEE